MVVTKHINLEDLEAYQLARELSRMGWDIYEKLTWQQRKIIGDQYIESTDSVGANIAEGYGRYHYLDRIKFLYNARGSLVEALHWGQLLIEWKWIKSVDTIAFQNCGQKVSIKLQNFISSIYRAKSP